VNEETDDGRDRSLDRMGDKDVWSLSKTQALRGTQATRKPTPISM